MPEDDTCTLTIQTRHLHWIIAGLHFLWDYVASGVDDEDWDAVVTGDRAYDFPLRSEIETFIEELNCGDYDA